MEFELTLLVLFRLPHFNDAIRRWKSARCGGGPIASYIFSVRPRELPSELPPPRRYTILCIGRARARSRFPLQPSASYMCVPGVPLSAPYKCTHTRQLSTLNLHSKGPAGMQVTSLSVRVMRCFCAARFLNTYIKQKRGSFIRERARDDSAADFAYRRQLPISLSPAAICILEVYIVCIRLLVSAPDYGAFASSILSGYRQGHVHACCSALYCSCAESRAS